MKRPLVLAVLLLAAVSGQRILAFCGFYVGKADTKLFNQASQVALVREGDHTVLTMANDFQGDPKEFALVVPVPTFIERRQIAVVDKGLLDHLDAFSAPRLVEYFDTDPCAPPPMPAAAAAGGVYLKKSGAKEDRRGVTVEATYTVGEYDILILSARESNGLESWLIENGYKIPSGAAPILGSYIKQNMRFFVAKVNLKEQAALGFTFLRPLQVSYDTPKFMLPIRLGTVNAKGPQDLFVFALTRTGRVETTNYRTVKLPTGMDLPLFVKEEFKDFYKAMFAEQVRKEDMHAVFLEYAWNMSWCDPCAADPLSKDQLRKLGVRVDNDNSPTFVSRLHVRYDAAHFPEDLVFQATSNQENFQGRYVLRHPFKGSSQCLEATRYEGDLNARREREAQNLAQLTGWKIEDIRRKAQGVKITDSGADAATARPAPWYRRAWAALSWD
ncbi:MAG TPA: DUF2330 domain-containing protein [Vicinamibacteria bacterium]|nr:DUF2330 domain-containing protein [Vicinamibacteria bacterium]